MKAACLALIAPGLALADCPPVPDIGAAQAELIEKVRAARNEHEARLIGLRLWELWARAPDAEAQAMLDRGMAARLSWDLEAAVVQFDALTEYCPHYAEGYNQRAFVNFLREDYEAALPDLDRALDLWPGHVAALAGRALTLMALGRTDEGQADLRDALALNPWLSERHLLIEPDEAL